MVGWKEENEPELEGVVLDPSYFLSNLEEYISLSEDRFTDAGDDFIPGWEDGVSLSAFKILAVSAFLYY